MEEKKELSFIGHIPIKEQNYIMGLKIPEGVSPLEWSEEYSEYEKSLYKAKQSSLPIEESSEYINSVISLQMAVGMYIKAIDLLNDIDMECYPEIYDLQEKVCDELAKLYYHDKDFFYPHISHLDIYNTDIKGMSPRDGMV